MPDLQRASLVAQTVKNLPAMWETLVWSLGWEDPLEEGMAVHSSILAWRIPTGEGAWWAIVHGDTKSWTQLRDSAQQIPLGNCVCFLYLWLYFYFVNRFMCNTIFFSQILCCAVLSLLVVSNSLQHHGLLLCPCGFSKQKYWSGLPCPPPGDRPKPGIESRSPALQADSLPSESPRKSFSIPNQ